MVALSAIAFTGNKRKVVCSLFTGGIILFSGSCYIVAAKNQKEPFAAVAPYGGFMLIFGWLALAFM